MNEGRFLCPIVQLIFRDLFLLHDSKIEFFTIIAIGEMKLVRWYQIQKLDMIHNLDETHMPAMDVGQPRLAPKIARYVFGSRAQ